MESFVPKRECVSHHFACDCREAYFTVLKNLAAELAGRILAGASHKELESDSRKLLRLIETKELDRLL